MQAARVSQGQSCDEERHCLNDSDSISYGAEFDACYSPVRLSLATSFLLTAIDICGRVPLPHIR